MKGGRKREGKGGEEGKMKREKGKRKKLSFRDREYKTVISTPRWPQS